MRTLPRRFFSAVSVAGFLVTSSLTAQELRTQDWAWIDSQAPYIVMVGCDPAYDYPCTVNHDGNFDTRDVDTANLGLAAIQKKIDSKSLVPSIYVDLFQMNEALVLSFVPYQMKNYQGMIGGGNHLNDTESAALVFKLKNILNFFEEGKEIKDANPQIAFAGGNYAARFITAAQSNFVANLNTDTSKKAGVGGSSRKVFSSDDRAMKYLDNASDSNSRVIFVREKNNHRIVPVTNWTELVKLNDEDTHVLIPPGAPKLAALNKATQVAYVIPREEFATVIEKNQSAKDAKGANTLMAAGSNIEVRVIQSATGGQIQTKQIARNMVNEDGGAGEANIPAAWRPKDDAIGGSTSPESHLGHIDLWIKIFPNFVDEKGAQVRRNPYYEAVKVEK